MNSFFSKIFGKMNKNTAKDTQQKAPEVLGLKLGGSFTINLCYSRREKKT